jgi:SNF2 family DNA or RNA helicase
MGVGITLDTADDLIMLDLPYDPDKLEQIEDRIHRASNMHKVSIWHLLSKNSIDMAIAEVSTTRRLITRALLDGSRGIDFSRKVVQHLTGKTEEAQLGDHQDTSN